MSPETMRAVVERSANGLTPGEIAADLGLKISAVRSVRTCPGPDCGKPFAARREHCSDRCKSRAWRAKKNSDPRTVRLRAAMDAVDRLAEVAADDDWLVLRAHITRTVRAREGKAS